MDKIDEDKVKQGLQETLDKLELENRELITELKELDELMRKVGFPGGLAALKMTALEFHEEASFKKDFPEDFLGESL